MSCDSERAFLQEYQLDHGVQFPPGGFGQVLGCTRLADSQAAVVKKVPFKSAQEHLTAYAACDESPWKEFRRERDILLQLKGNDLFCQMYAIYWSDDRSKQDDMYIVMHRYRTDLFDVAMPGSSNYRDLTVQELQLVARRTIMAVAQLHSFDIIHRDIKLENVFLDDPTDMNTSALGDFGCARVLPPSTDEVTSKIGTKTFWAPEMLLGNGHYGQAVDIWSLGCFLYTLHVKQYPFGVDRHPRFARNVASATWTRSVIADDHLRHLLEACFQLDPEARPSAEDMLKHSYFAQ